MELVALDTDVVTLRLNRFELGVINNALNEMANGVDIADSEFQSRLGGSRPDVRQVLAEVGDVYRALA